MRIAQKETYQGSLEKGTPVQLSLETRRKTCTEGLRTVITYKGGREEEDITIQQGGWGFLAQWEGRRERARCQCNNSRDQTRDTSEPKEERGGGLSARTRVKEGIHLEG